VRCGETAKVFKEGGGGLKQSAPGACENLSQRDRKIRCLVAIGASEIPPEHLARREPQADEIVVAEAIISLAKGDWAPKIFLLDQISFERYGDSSERWLLSSVDCPTESETSKLIVVFLNTDIYIYIYMST
jgi:hypothetical protein